MIARPRIKLWNVSVCGTKANLGPDCISLISLMLWKLLVFYGCDDGDRSGGDGINISEQSERKSDGINECFGKMSSKIKFNSMACMVGALCVCCSAIVMYLYSVCVRARHSGSSLILATTCVSINLCTDSADT